MNIAYHLHGCSFLLQPWALDPGRVKDRALQQLAFQLLDFSILHGCLEVLKKSCFLYVNLSDFAPRRPGALVGELWRLPAAHLEIYANNKYNENLCKYKQTHTLGSKTMVNTSKC